MRRTKHFRRVEKKLHNRLRTSTANHRHPCNKSSKQNSQKQETTRDCAKKLSCEAAKACLRQRRDFCSTLARYRVQRQEAGSPVSQETRGTRRQTPHRRSHRRHTESATRSRARRRFLPPASKTRVSTKASRASPWLTRECRSAGRRAHRRRSASSKEASRSCPSDCGEPRRR